MEDNLSKLINNVFDFIEKAIDQFQKEPKFSVINFCIATELSLKAYGKVAEQNRFLPYCLETDIIHIHST